MKNIVVCSDGTGQSYAGTEANVLRLYNLALKNPSRQIACVCGGSVLIGHDLRGLTSLQLFCDRVHEVRQDRRGQPQRLAARGERKEDGAGERGRSEPVAGRHAVSEKILARVQVGQPTVAA